MKILLQKLKKDIQCEYFVSDHSFQQNISSYFDNQNLFQVQYIGSSTFKRSSLVEERNGRYGSMLYKSIATCRTLSSYKKYVDLHKSTTFESLFHLRKGISYSSQITNAQDKIRKTTYFPHNVEHNNIHENVIYDMAHFI